MQGTEAPPAPASAPIQKPSKIVPKAQALAQESTKGKTQDEEESSSLEKKSSKTGKSKKKDSVKKDLIHRID